MARHPRESSHLVRAARTGYPEQVNQPLKAVVRNGHIVVAEPADLPEGTEVSGAIVDGEIDFAEPWMDADEAKAFNEEMNASLAEADAGLGVDGDTLIAELRAQLAS